MPGVQIPQRPPLTLFIVHSGRFGRNLINLNSFPQRPYPLKYLRSIQASLQNRLISQPF